MQGKFDEAYDAFFKATWSAAQQDSAYYALAQIAKNTCFQLTCFMIVPVTHQ